MRIPGEDPFPGMQCHEARTPEGGGTRARTHPDTKKRREELLAQLTTLP